MVKRLLLLGVAALALGVFALSIGGVSLPGQGVANAQAPTSPPVTEDPSEPADQPEAPDTDDQPAAPDQDDQPAQPEAPAAPPAPAPPAEPTQPDDSGDGGCGADDARAHASGEDDCVPQAPTSPKPGPVPAEHHKKHGESGSGEKGSSEKGSVQAKTVQSRPQVWENVANVGSGTDTGTIPQGGIQAGAGGTADASPVSTLFLGSGALLLVLAAGGLMAHRRRLES